MSENQAPSDEVDKNKFPPLVKRFQSLFIDQLLIIVCMVIFSRLLINTGEKDSEGLRAFLFIGLFFLYEPISMSFGCTLGNKISGIRVRRFGDETRRINLVDSYVRFFVKLTLGTISFFTVTSNKYKRAIHDMAARSIMVYSAGEKMQ